MDFCHGCSFFFFLINTMLIQCVQWIVVLFNNLPFILGEICLSEEHFQQTESQLRCFEYATNQNIVTHQLHKWTWQNLKSGLSKAALQT